MSDQTGSVTALGKEEESPVYDRLRSLGTNSILLVGVFLSAFPLYYMAVSTTFSRPEFFLFPPKFLPGSKAIENYVTLFNETLFPQTLLNTVIYAVGTTIGTVIVATLAGYAFSMFTFRGRKPIFSLILAMMSIPFQLIAIALFSLLVDYQLIDTYIGGILPVLVFPIVILMMKQNFDQLDLENILRSARVDGASEFQIFYHIALPVMRPAIAAATIVTFLFRAGGLFWPLIVFRSQKMYTVTVFIANQIGYRTSTDWTVVMPAGFLLTIPSIIVAIYFQQHFVKGMMAGSTK